MATHAPITGAPTRAPAFRPIPLHRRETIEAEIELHLQRVELLLARLDRVDTAVEDMEDDDPAGDHLDRGEGEGDHGRGLLTERPRYALDQTGGPLNYQQASNDHQAREAGLVRSPTGVWRHAN